MRYEFTDWEIPEDCELVDFLPGSRGSWTEPASAPYREWAFSYLVEHVDYIEEWPPAPGAVLRYESRLVCPEDHDLYSVDVVACIEDVPEMHPDGTVTVAVEGTAHWSGMLPVQSLRGRR